MRRHDPVESLNKLEQLKPSALAIVLVASGCGLWAPQSLLDALRLSQLAEENAAWLGVAFLLAALVTVVGIIRWVARRYRARKDAVRVDAAMDERLRRLGEDEKQVLRAFFVEHAERVFLSRDRGEVNGLVADGILIRERGSHIWSAWPHCLSEAAREKLEANIELLDGTTNLVVDDSHNRPP